MLLITRRTGESIIINGTIQVKIIDVKGGRVKLGFEYPEGNTIYRAELFQKIQEENRHAATTSTDPAKLADSLHKLLASKQKLKKDDSNSTNE